MYTAILTYQMAKRRKFLKAVRCISYWSSRRPFFRL